MKSSPKTKFIPALGYDWLTGVYDLAIRLTMPETKFRQRLLEEVKPKAREKILEFGFGTGQNLITGIRKSPGSIFWGLDIDPKVKAIAGRKLQRQHMQVPLFLYDGQTFPFANNEFDKVFSSLVFHQLDPRTKKRCLQEIYRVVKPGGSLVIGDWGKPKSKYRRFLFYAVQLLDGFATTRENVAGRLPEYMAAAGFTGAEEVGYINTRIGTYCYYTGRKPE